MASELLRALGIGAGTAGFGASVHGSGLGELLEPLDYPRQALYNAVRSPFKAVETGDWSHLLGAIPGIAGGALGLALGGPVGMLAGSALGGALQGFGKSTGREEFNAPSVSDLTGTEDFLPNLAVGMLTDPLTYAGGLGVAKQSKKFVPTGAIVSASDQPILSAIGGASASKVPVPVSAGARNARPISETAALAKAAPVVEAVAPVAKATEIVPTYYSRLEQAIQGLPDHPMKAEGVLNQIKKAKGGVSGEEIHWTGIEDMLNARKGQRVSKGELLDHFKANEIQVEEKWLTGPNGGLKYPNAVTPGGEGHFELLLKMPEPQLPQGYTFKTVPNQNSNTGTSVQILGKDGKPMFNNAFYHDEQQALQSFNASLGRRHRTNHFQGEEDVLAFVQGHTRTGPKGEKILHVDSVQSDWHQAGSRGGYKSASTHLSEANTGKVPDAPFKENWHELAMKRVIRYAAENGYDAITVNRAEQAAKVAGTSPGAKHIAERYGRGAGESYLSGSQRELLATLEAKRASGVALTETEQAAVRQLEVAANTNAAEGSIPKWMKKYGKQYGVEVKAELSAPDVAALEKQFDATSLQWGSAKHPDEIRQIEQRLYEIRNQLDNAKNAPVFDVTRMNMTPQLREQVLTRGQPLMSYAPLAAAGGGSALLAAMLGQQPRA